VLLSRIELGSEILTIIVHPPLPAVNDAQRVSKIPDLTEVETHGGRGAEFATAFHPSAIRMRTAPYVDQEAHSIAPEYAWIHDHRISGRIDPPESDE
jgi:hypothetical protein